MRKINFTVLFVLLAFICVITFINSNNSFAGEKLDNEIIDKLNTLIGKNKTYETSPFTALRIQRKRGPKKCGTPIMTEIMKALPKLSPSARAIVDGYIFKESPISADRSWKKGYKQVNNEFGLSNTYVSDNFVIIWGDETYSPTFGTGIPPDDDDGSGYPDFVEKLSSYFENAWTKEIDEMGLKKPKKSSDKLIDIYIANTAGDIKPGKLTLDSSFFAYTNTYTSNNMPYIVVNNVMPTTENDDPAGAETGSQKVTAAHEFSHAIQFAYDRNESVWWQEASAVWMEDQVYDEVNDYIYTYMMTDTSSIDQYSPWTSVPEIHLTKVNGFHEYGTVIFAKYLSQNYTGSDMFKDVWTLCKKKSAIKAINSYLKNNGSSLKNGFIDFAVKNLDLGKNYEEGSRWQNVSKIKTISFSAPGTIKKSIKSTSSFPHPPAYLGSNYIEIDTSVTGTLKITFNGEKKYKGKKVKWKVKAVKQNIADNLEVSNVSLNKSNKG
ncbi:MAG: hypothetical protein D6734_12990, partial [Candidatus Schekmanbacteria bacterium]